MCQRTFGLLICLRYPHLLRLAGPNYAKAADTHLPSRTRYSKVPGRGSRAETLQCDSSFVEICGALEC